MAAYQQPQQLQQPQNPYGIPSATIEPTQPYLQQLRSMAHRGDVLVRSGFVVNPLSEADIDDKKRCRRCNARCSSRKNKFKPDGKGSKRGRKKLALKPASSPRPRVQLVSPILTLSDEETEGAKEDEKPPRPVLKCQFHTGRVVRMYWTCCHAYISASGCIWAPEHLTRTYNPGDLLTRHQFHRTAPGVLSRRPHRAVAIDCEMGTAYDGESELIRVTLVDYFTSEILLDSLVYPQVEMQHYNTKWSGVSRRQMDEARAKGKCITGGLPAVREAVWRWVGPETVVVGHAVHNDLASLRWIHTLVVDSLVLATVARAEREKREEEEAQKEAAAADDVALEQDADLISFHQLEAKGQEDAKKVNGNAEEKVTAKRKPGGLSLKALTSEMFDRQIQKGKAGHDSLEDALAARDIVHWFVSQRSAEAQARKQEPAVTGFW